MKIIKRFVIAAVVCLTLSACISAHTYVDPQFHTTDYDQIARPAQPVPVQVNVHFERNGEAYPSADPQLRTIVERALRATAVFIPKSDTSGIAVIKVVASNIGDVGAARAKGFGTGLTFGVVGSTVNDKYEFTCSYQDVSGKQYSNSYHHALYTTIGKACAPVSTKPTTPILGFEEVVEDIMLTFVKDLQAQDLVAAPGSL